MQIETQRNENYYKTLHELDEDYQSEDETRILEKIHFGRGLISAD
jgi:hypothetical protein